jgi:hypothetical protein
MPDEFQDHRRPMLDGTHLYRYRIKGKICQGIIGIPANYPLPRVHRGCYSTLAHLSNHHTYIVPGPTNQTLYPTSHIWKNNNAHRDVPTHSNNLLRPHSHPSIPFPLSRLFLDNTRLFNRSITFNTPLIPISRCFRTRQTSITRHSSPTSPYACFIT